LILLVFHVVLKDIWVYVDVLEKKGKMVFRVFKVYPVHKASALRVI
jgi:hypothetical protein